MNIFSKLGSVLTGSTEDEPTEADLKKERIELHARSVRNGPVKFNQPTNGQIRREKHRALKRKERKAYRAEVKNYLEKQRLASIVRGQLQLAGVIPFADGREVDPRDSLTSTAWIVQRFGVEIEQTGRRSFKKGDVITALVNAAKFYNSATGAGIKFPADFTPAIWLAEEDAA